MNVSSPKRERHKRSASTHECDYCDRFTPDLGEGDYANRLINHIKTHCFPISSGKLAPATKHLTKLKMLKEKIGNKTQTEAEAIILRFRQIRIIQIQNSKFKFRISSIGNDNLLNQGEFKLVI